jgi:hypothetical protein
MPKTHNYLVLIIEPKQRKYLYWLNINIMENKFDIGIKLLTEYNKTKM